MSIKNVALLGGTGTLGAPVLKALKASSFNISVLNRESSRSTYPDVNVITIPDDLNVSRLTDLFKQNSIDALVITIKANQIDQLKKIIEAAFNAGVQRILPPDFGSCDSADEKTNELLPLMAGKKTIRDYLISLEGKGKLTWTSLITAHFFDWGFTNLLLKFDVKGRKAYIIDGGDIKFSGSTLDFIGEAVIRILERPNETANKILYIHSHHVTQNEVLVVLEKVTGTQFEKIPQSSEEVLKEVRPKMLAGDGDAYEEAVAVWGIVAADWSDRKDFANDLLGLKMLDLEETVRKAIGA